ncbi:type II toxin-antitoxin system Phd/YefM family antitoxin [Candidatus Tisiphia endosymbiont of Ptychoptera albimana]|uniref:type II toxin-antitoxin system Phd/YefM family antitoxin n=1 Tax=Candidatus Tisiphia endosymbiont of Ptychoptera albimana TaxID=3066260 RepID=UPI00312C9FE3
MNFITTVEAREHFSEVLNRSAYGKERIIFTRRGKNLVAIIPMEDLNLLEALEDKLDVEDAKKSLEEGKQHGTMSLADFKKNEDI